MMDLPESLINNTALENVKIGDVYYIEMSQTDGITPKDGYNTRDKFFVVLGFDCQGNIYGGVVINSNINQHLPTIVKQYHMPILCEKYEFLSYDSFVNCSQLMTATPAKLLQGDKVGEIQKEDINLIIATVCDYPNANKEKLRRFGLL